MKTKKIIVWGVLFLVGVSRNLPASDLSDFDPKYTFKVTLKGKGESFDKKGKYLEWREGQLIVKDKKGNVLMSYPQGSIDVIEGSRRSRGSNILKGLGYGSAGGIGLGLAVGLPVIFSDDFGGCSDDCDSDLSALGLLIPLTGGLLLGSAIGLVVGAILPTDSKIKIVPNISRNNGDTHVGAGMAMSF